MSLYIGDPRAHTKIVRKQVFTGTPRVPKITVEVKRVYAENSCNLSKAMPW